ncbi:nitrilase [Leucobacter sp. cx-328]|uniref:nitrilase-related carbon-nitrogen hydrolase n=1 Tax=unclassified Leucobacter TaxID=2621730 RepID=UPI00165D9F8C|nr:MULTISPECIES: nitrilase-related carbon-nitrogen hydrolase [unclassified Leucobacter]MBC9945046.1 nitrilase [Leucobacter sp. cx-328]
MRIALMQDEAVPLNIEANLATMRCAAEVASETGAELLLTPELWVSGYAPRALAEWLTVERIATIRPAISAMAKDTGIAIAASFPLAREDGGFSIAAGLWDASGAEVLLYEKVHLWADEEPLAFTPSTAAPAIAEWNGRRVAFQICYDIEFPEPARYLAQQGIDLLLVPTAIDGFSRYVPEVLVRARAAENSMVVAYADHAARRHQGDDPAAGFTGMSTVAGRDGLLLASAGRETQLLFADLPEVEPVEDIAADYLADVQPQLYATWG